MMGELLFSVTRADLDIQTFRCGGKGGQNVNKRDTGVRIVHRASGAEGKACDERMQGQNKKLAFSRMVESPRFKLWHAAEIQRRLGRKNLESEVLAAVEKAMRPENIREEVF